MDPSIIKIAADSSTFPTDEILRDIVDPEREIVEARRKIYMTQK